MKMTTEKFDEILHLEDPDFAEKFAKAVGLKKGETLEIKTTQFERTDGLKPVENPKDLFGVIHTLFPETLKEIGMGQWGEHGLWLFPYQWYDHIPEGMELMCIDGSVEPFEAGVTDDDMRFGMLAYGIVPDFERLTAA